jgi:hypothetical protein
MVPLRFFAFFLCGFCWGVVYDPARRRSKCFAFASECLYYNRMELTTIEVNYNLCTGLNFFVARFLSNEIKN